MSHAIKGISVKEIPETGESEMPGTVYAMKIPDTEILHKAVKNTTRGIDGISALLNNVSLLRESHIAGRKIFFNQNLPFYTCLNALENLWQKEMPDGSVYQVILSFDWENDKPIEKQIKRIR